MNSDARRTVSSAAPVMKKDQGAMGQAKSTQSRVEKALKARIKAQERAVGKTRSFRKSVGNHKPH